uniref:Protein kinase domain-containing protein n=1 Tax=Mola mola TaxID=94237 RepID=A0A3Q3VN20_MOLML
FDPLSAVLDKSIPNVSVVEHRVRDRPSRLIQKNSKAIDKRCFSNHPLCALFSDILVALVKNQLCSEWLDHAQSESVHRVLICLRLLIRDPQHQVQFKYSSLLLGALLALTTLAESLQCKEAIGELQIVENLLVILWEYDLLSKRKSAELLRLLSWVRDQVRELEGLPVLLTSLYRQHLKLLWSIAWVLVQLCQDPNNRMEIQSWGGVQQLLQLLNSDRQHICDHLLTETLSSANAASRIQREHTREELSQAAHLIIPCKQHIAFCDSECYAFQTLRFLFKLFLLFIDVGLYVRDFEAYEGLQTQVSLYTEDEQRGLRESIEAVDQNRAPLKAISGYSILDHLGSGAFGSVFNVQKQSGPNILALKEVDLHNPAFGKDKKSRDSNVANIISEHHLRMTHPNIVKYYKTFLEGDKLYIVMELIGGVSLAEHLNSLKEKQQRFAEDRIWNIFIQMCLALHHLHKEKRIVQRDLTPNNIMLGDKDKVIITDFGLAKQKQENSKLTLVVGTILYSCEEREKANVWALGCILYQMATLQPPFYSSNMLSLASQIVEAIYELLEKGVFSESHRRDQMVIPHAEQRPDIVAVSSRISDLMMKLMDGLYVSQNALQRRVERDRKRAQKYFQERNMSRMTCCHAKLPLIVFIQSELVDKQKKPPSLFDLIQWVCSNIRVSRDRCVSQRKVRQIDEPIQRLMVQLFVSLLQLPPAMHRIVKRRLIESFKKSLFHSGSDPYNLKVELSKVCLVSRARLVQKCSKCSAASEVISCTNLPFQGLIEELLEESSYYEAARSR